MSDTGYFALVKLGRGNNILYSEYIRAKKDALKRSGLIFLIQNVLETNKELCTKKQAAKILDRLLEVGGINEQ